MIRVANAPCSWGALEFEEAGGPPAWQRVLDEMRQAGYAGTELGDWGFLPADPDALREALAGRELGLVGGFVPVALSDPNAHREGRERAVRTARLMAAVAPDARLVLADDNGKDSIRTRMAGRVRTEHGLEPDRFRILARGAEEIAAAVADDAGLKTVFHHHCAGFVETPDEVERLLELTSANRLSLCFDTGHWTYAGGNALAAVQRFAGRIGHVHFKDCDPAVAESVRAAEGDYFEAVRRGVFCELGRGAVDFPSILNTLKRQPYSGWIVVEQDVFPGMGDPLGSAQRSRQYLDALGV